MIKTEMGKTVNYTHTELAAAYHLWYEKNIDMYKIWIERCKFNKINPWLSFRMNDAELFNVPNHLLSEYYYEHLNDYARVRHRKPRTAIECCRDYEIDDHRNLLLLYIEEMLERYDVYGIELDFQREIYCFRIGHEWDGSSIMTDFMEKVKNIVVAAEQKHQHRIQIMVRCHAHPEDSLELGFDIATWAQNGFLDIVVPAPNWLTSDNSMPLKLWHSLLGPYGVSVVGCIDANINSNPDYFSIIEKDLNTKGLRKHSYETLCASAVSIMSQLPHNNIYLFNYMDCPKTVEENLKKFFLSTEDYKRIIATVGDIEKIVNLPRRHVLTYNDTTLPWKQNNAVLPLVFSDSNEAKYLRIETGRIPDGKHCVLRLGMTKLGNTEIYVNSIKATYIRREPCEAPVLTESPLYCFEIPQTALKSQVQIVEIIAENITVDYADITVT